MKEQRSHRRFSRSIATLISIIVLAAPLRADKNQANINDPFEPTPPQVVDDMLKLANVTASDYVFDLEIGRASCRERV
jgi:hypothetical protein